jgi:hypothetical protein
VEFFSNCLTLFTKYKGFDALQKNVFIPLQKLANRTKKIKLKKCVKTKP